MTEISPARPNAWTDESFKRFWYRMGEIFGTAWYRDNGSEPPELWRATLSEIDLKRAAAVIDHYRRSGDAFPPNLSQVMRLARELRPTEPYKALPTPTRDMEKIATGIAALRHPEKHIYRSIFMPRESYGDVQNAWYKSGKPRGQFEAERLIKNGWTADRERTFRENTRICHFQLPPEPTVEDMQRAEAARK